MILLSANHDSVLPTRTDGHQAQVCLVKPIGIADLPPAIAAALGRFGELHALPKDC